MSVFSSILEYRYLSFDKTYTTVEPFKVTSWSKWSTHFLHDIATKLNYMYTGILKYGMIVYYATKAYRENIRLHD